MPDVLNTGVSALLAFQRSMATITHNVSNSTTAGYSRQRVQLHAMPGQYMGFGYIGNGVQTTAVDRQSDQFVFDRILDSSSSTGRLQPFSTLSARLDRIMSDPATGLAGPLNAFFTSMEGVSADPASSATRNDLVARADALASRFRSLDSQIDNLQSDVNSRLQFNVEQINGDMRELADLNRQIRASIGDRPNDLLDRRDIVLERLGTKMGITARVQSDNTVNVFANTGQSLVFGTTAGDFTLTPDRFDPARMSIALRTNAGVTPLSDVDVGGELGGLLDFRREVLDPAATNLGRIGVALTTAINAQHAEGVDLNGNLGGAFFSTPIPAARPSNANSGAASLAATISNPNALTGDNYELRYNGATWGAYRATTGETLTMTGAGTVGSPFTIGGVSIVVSGAPSSGDSFLLRPTADAAGQISSAISDPAVIAAADALRSSSNVANIGDGAIGRVTVDNVTNPSLLTPVTIQFTSATTYSINGSGSFAYTPGSSISVNGWRTEISGTPSVGDRFGINPRGAGSGDNGNARELAGLVRSRLLSGDTQTLSMSTAALVNTVGSATRTAETTLEAEQVVNRQLQDQRQSVSGVNLDEEAANLVRFQQAYQAASQVMSVADTMFQSLMSAIRG